MAEEETSVQTMPLDELRRRTTLVHRLLRAAREEVQRAAGGDDARALRLQAILAEVQELLPGLVHEAAGESDPQHPSGPALAHDDDAPPASLSSAQMARARRILGELQEGIERMDLLDSIGRGIDELLAMIEASQGELLRQRHG
jgi:hypothetical protein